MLILAASLFFAHPTPLDMPRAEAYLVRADGVRRLEDRFNTLDLWTSRAVLGRWEDDDGRAFMVAKLDVLAPAFSETAVTRVAYAASTATIDAKKDLDLRDDAIRLLSPVGKADEPTRPHQPIRGLRDVLYFQGTNTSAIVCAFWPEKAPAWYLATWELALGDDFDSSRETFEKDFLGNWEQIVETELPSERVQPGEKAARRTGPPKKRPPADERELLRADARHSVTNYASWHVTDADEFTILDHLPPSGAFMSALTNDLKRMRAAYAETVPSPLDGSNVLCVARLFSDRNEYLDAVGDDLKWSAAYWCPSRRELVAYLPADGGGELLKTIRHEAFHQYLSYATAMIAASPWFNEGYAQYFEDAASCDWELGAVELDFEKFADAIPALLQMDYAQFYDGTDLQRRFNYRLAWSIAYFVENGAPKIRFQPFKDLKRDYIAALLEMHDMRQATAVVFADKARLELFVNEWKKFWKNLR